MSWLRKMAREIINEPILKIKMSWFRKEIIFMNLYNS